jgi:DNA-damage-inducible protein J
MTKTATIHARIDSKTKRKAEHVLTQLGLSPTEAIRLFYHQICLQKGLPFSVEIPNAETADVLRKSSKGEDVESFQKLEDMFASWDK